MMHTIFTVAAIILYLATFCRLLADIKANSSNSDFSKLVTGLFVASVIMHIGSLHYSVFSDQALHLGFFKVSSLIFCVIAIISLMSIFRNLPIGNLILLLLPCAALSLAVNLWVSSPTNKVITDTGLIIHIVVSILAYSVMTIASFQALTLAWQERQLKSHEFSDFFIYLPPLQTMEKLLFEMIWLGFALLTFSIGSGFIFLEDMFAQHLAHKTVLSMLAWVIFSVLLYGRHAQGWRGATATKWTLGGFVLLMLAYFGSKFVLEIILQRV